MSSFTVREETPASDVETLSLYESVGWTAYLREPQVLSDALKNSSFVATARDADGELIGLARTVSDDATICYLQDILVRPSSQGAGVGRALLERVLARYGHVRQIVLITDNDPAQRAFYEAMGFTEGSDFSPAPLRMFARMR